MQQITVGHHYDGSSCNGCDIEVLAALCPGFDVERFGIINTGNPKHADIFLVTGSVNEQNIGVVQEIYNQMVEPKVVIACGICACSAGIFHDCYNVIGGVDQAIPVDVYAPGCAVRPEAIIVRSCGTRYPGRKSKALRIPKRVKALQSEFIPLTIEGLPALAAEKKAEGARFVQMLCVNTEEGIDLVYSFMKDGVLTNHEIKGVKKGTTVPSVTDQFLAAFVFGQGARSVRRGHRGHRHRLRRQLLRARAERAHDHHLAGAEGGSREGEEGGRGESRQGARCEGRGGLVRGEPSRGEVQADRRRHQAFGLR